MPCGHGPGLLSELVLLLFSCQVVFASLWPHGLQPARPPYPSPSPRACPSSFPLSEWCHPTISSSDVLFCPTQSFPASGSFPMSGFFAARGQSIGALASASVLPMTIQDWFLLGRTGLISLLSKGLKSILQHHNLKVSIIWHSAFFMVQLSCSYMTTGKAIVLAIWTSVSKVMSLFFNMLYRFV